MNSRPTKVRLSPVPWTYVIFGFLTFPYHSCLPLILFSPAYSRLPFHRHIPCNGACVSDGAYTYFTHSNEIYCKEHFEAYILPQCEGCGCTILEKKYLTVSTKSLAPLQTRGNLYTTLVLESICHSQFECFNHPFYVIYEVRTQALLLESKYHSQSKQNAPNSAIPLLWVSYLYHFCNSTRGLNPRARIWRSATLRASCMAFCSAPCGQRNALLQDIARVVGTISPGTFPFFWLNLLLTCLQYPLYVQITNR